VSFFVVAYSLAFRALGRGDMYPGWDLIGPAHGQFLLSIGPFDAVVEEILRTVRAFYYWTSKDSLIYTLVPAGLGHWWPWEHWVHLVTLALFLLSLAAGARSVGLGLREGWIVLLAWGASPALLSFAIAGPFISACMPHALALAIVASPALRRRPLLSLVLALLVGELAWHLYLTGRTVFLVFLLAAVLERAAPARTRLAWSCAGTLGLIVALRFSGWTENELLSGGAFVGRDWTGAALDLTAALFLDLDTPLLWLLGVLAFVFFRRRRGLLLALFAAQLALLLLLGAHGAQKLLTRRFLLVDFYALLSVLSAFAEATGPRRVLRPLIVLALLAGNVWQLASLHAFYSRPFDERRRQVLPYVQARGDYIVRPDSLQGARSVRAWVDGGGVALLLYGMSAYPENATDPSAVLERLYLQLGHERFVSSVLVFGSERCRYSCVPVRRLDTLGPVLDDVIAGRGPVAPDRLRLFYLLEDRAEAGLRESALVFAEVRRRFLVRPLPGREGIFGRARLDPALPAQAPFVVEPEQASYALQRTPAVRDEAPDLLRFPLDLAWLPGIVGDGRYVAARPFGKQPFSLRWQATLTACESRSYEALVGVTGDLSLRLDGREVLRGEDQGFRLTAVSLPLDAGRHRLEVAFASRRGLPRLLLDLRAAPGDPWARRGPVRCAPPAARTARTAVGPE
jgi:hypothetical protein